jgi:hypothetical protein
MTKQMSVTQGLAELKLLDKRLNKRLDCAPWVTVSTKTNRVNEDDLKKTAESFYKSYMDLVSRRDTIKRAIVISNALTTVTIGGIWNGTVAEAIEHKSSLMYKKKLLEKIKGDILTAESDFRTAVEERDSRLDRLLSSELGKDVKTNPETIATLSASFQETNKITIVDPLNLKVLAADLEETIDAFEANVDWVLSETNGKTLISV